MSKLPLILLLCAILVISGCGEGKSYSFAEKKHNAIATIKDQLELVRKSRRSDNPKRVAYGRYAEPKLAKAIEYLSNLSGPIKLDPLPFLARFRVEVRTRSKQIYRPHICIRWLEKGMNISEIFIEDEKGNTYEFPAFHKAKEEYNAYNKSTFFRIDVARIRVTGGRMPEKLSDPTPAAGKLYVLPMPLEAFRGEIRIGLVTANGKRTPAIEAFVEPGFYEESKPQYDRLGN